MPPPEKKRGYIEYLATTQTFVDSEINLEKVEKESHQKPSFRNSSLSFLQTEN